MGWVWSAGAALRVHIDEAIHSDEVVVELKEVVQSVVSSSFLERWPAEGRIGSSGPHLMFAGSDGCPSSSDSFGAVRVPYRAAVLQQWADVCFVCPMFHCSRPSLEASSS